MGFTVEVGEKSKHVMRAHTATQAFSSMLSSAKSVQWEHTPPQRHWHLLTNATNAQQAVLAKSQAWRQVIVAQRQRQENTTMGKIAHKGPTRTRRAKRRANLALPENMGYPKRATSCMYRKIRVVRIAQSPNTAVRKESPMKMDAMLVLPAEPARARGCLQGIRVHHVLRADTMTGRRRAAVPKEPTRMRRA